MSEIIQTEPLLTRRFADPSTEARRLSPGFCMRCAGDQPDPTRRVCAPCREMSRRAYARRVPRATRTTQFDHVTDVELAYMAGLIDGEGCILLFRRGGYMMLRLTIAMCDEPTIAWLSQRWNKSTSNHQRVDGNRRRSYTIQLHGLTAVELCRRMLPYLITKRAHAELALQYAETLDYRVTPDAPYFLTDEMRAKRDACLTELRILNKRGR